MPSTKRNLKLSICIPLYNAEHTLHATLQSVLGQTYPDFELVIVDDCSKDKSAQIVKSFKDKRIHYYLNKTNLGCGGNLAECAHKATGDILLYLCGDDVLDVTAANLVVQAFAADPDLGIVTRPYYWFEAQVRTPVRLTRQFFKDQLVSLASSHAKITDVIALSDQISGIGLRKSYLAKSFANDPFIEMASMVCHVFRNHPALILAKNLVAVRIGYSGSTNPKVYAKSPMLAWYNLIKRSYPEPRYARLRQYLTANFIANNYIGLVQIKNYGTWRQLFRELALLLRLKPTNIVNLQFLAYALGTILTPRFLLRRLVKIYKTKINTHLINPKIAIKL